MDHDDVVETMPHAHSVEAKRKRREPASGVCSCPMLRSDFDGSINDDDDLKLPKTNRGAMSLLLLIMTVRGA